MTSYAEIDAAIIANIVGHCSKTALVAAKCMDQLRLPTTDEILYRVCRRIEFLAEGRRIESQGDPTMPRHSDVRAQGAESDA